MRHGLDIGVGYKGCYDQQGRVHGTYKDPAFEVAAQPPKQWQTPHLCT